MSCGGLADDEEILTESLFISVKKLWWSSHGDLFDEEWLGYLQWTITKVTGLKYLVILAWYKYETLQGLETTWRWTDHLILIYGFV